MGQHGGALRLTLAGVALGHRDLRHGWLAARPVHGRFSERDPCAITHSPPTSRWENSSS
jgi:hypothetical protein